MFHDWDSYFLLIGSAAGALIGLLFVVVTLTERMERTSALRGASVYMTPTVFNFAAVVILSGLALTPGLPIKVLAATVGIGALIAFAYAAATSWWLHVGGIVPDEPPHWTDFWFYGAAPAAVYAALAVSAIAVWQDAPCASYTVAWIGMVLLLIGIRNAWDLVTWLAPHRKADATQS